MIIKSLEQTIDELHWVGHNVIYASLSLLAMKELQNGVIIKQLKGLLLLFYHFEKQFQVDRGLVIRRKK